MQLRFVLDEDTGRELATKLRRAGHDVERVVEIDALGTGATDESVREYARRTNRLIVTHDDDFVAVQSDSHAGVFYAPNQRLDTFRLFRIIQRVSEAYSKQEAVPPVVYLTEDWID